MLRGGETRCSAVWSAHLFWVQRAIGSNPVTLMRCGEKEDTLSMIMLALRFQTCRLLSAKVMMSLSRVTKRAMMSP